MMRIRQTYISQIALFVCLLMLTACVTTEKGSSGNDPTVITQEEIQGVGEISDAYNLVRRLEPQWLEKRGRNSLQQPGDITVYVEDNRQGGPEALRSIDVVDIESIEFLRADEATMRYGSGHDNGVILVNLKGS